jgi:trk system potassium uptake protein TrkA
VSLTGLDELNMIISLYGGSLRRAAGHHQAGPGGKQQDLDSLPIGSVVCPKELCCNTIVRYVRAMQNQTGAA